MNHNKKNELVHGLLVKISETLSNKPFTDIDSQIKVDVYSLLDQLYLAGVEQGKMAEILRQQCQLTKIMDESQEKQNKIVEWLSNKVEKEEMNR